MGGRCDLRGSAVLLSCAAEGLPGQERERIGGASGAGNVLNSYPGRKIAESSCALACKDPWGAS